MALQVLTPPLTRTLTTQLRFENELDIDDPAEAARLEALNEEATALIERHCRRTFARQVVQESVPGFGEVILQLSLTPIASVSEVLLRSEPIVDVVVEDAERGWLRRDAGWDATALSRWWLTEQRRSEPMLSEFHITYTAGYLLPGDDRLGTYGVDATTRSFTSAAGDFPLLAAGDRIVTAGFAQPANNGTFTVESRTATAIVVTSTTVVTEAAAPNRQLRVRTLPTDLERAQIELVKALYFARQQDPAVSSVRVGDLAYTYRDPAEIGLMGFPPQVLGWLRPWIREA
ncbi:MAG TPA: hypothetical protein VNP04_15535 [Alphaproteobacteria bacterium]|nr:hypothetical protein [Alphaproteobacteria bacterium]